MCAHTHTLTHTDTHRHTPNLHPWLFLTRQKFWHLWARPSPSNNGLELPLLMGRVLSGSPQSPPLPFGSLTARQRVIAFGLALWLFLW